VDGPDVAQQQPWPLLLTLLIKHQGRVAGVADAVRAEDGTAAAAHQHAHAVVAQHVVVLQRAGAPILDDDAAVAVVGDQVMTDDAAAK
jgi:hypothetical protein